MTILSSREEEKDAAGPAQAGRNIGRPDGGWRPLFIIMNAGSGLDNAVAARENVARLMSEVDQPYEMLLCRRPRELSAMAERAAEQAARHNGIVVAAGGDGTIRTVAQLVLAAGLPFGVLPQGTFNYFARDNGLPADPVTAAAALVAGVRAGSERLVQVGQLNDQIFLVNASLGLYPQLLEDREVFKQRYGRSRMVAKWSGLLTLLRRDTEMLLRLEYSDRQQAHGADVMRACTLFVGNNALQLDQVGLTEGQGAPGGQLVALVLPPMNVAERLIIAMRGMLGQLGSAPNTAQFFCRHLIVEPLARAQRRQVKVAMDGESAWMRPPLVFRVAPRPLRLVVPPSGWSAA
ncbi:MAG TPA: diacylglycerol kinase [Oxalobacteraceae bacterium]|nr:diacylglycerol kinase [Oxalobacteraceae bacterium]